jgi:hypothetical protein
VRRQRGELAPALEGLRRGQALFPPGSADAAQVGGVAAELGRQVFRGDVPR